MTRHEENIENILASPDNDGLVLPLRISTVAATILCLFSLFALYYFHQKCSNGECAGAYRIGNHRVNVTEIDPASPQAIVVAEEAKETSGSTEEKRITGTTYNHDTIVCHEDLESYSKSIHFKIPNGNLIQEGGVLPRYSHTPKPRLEECRGEAKRKRLSLYNAFQSIVSSFPTNAVDNLTNITWSNKTPVSSPTCDIIGSPNTFLSQDNYFGVNFLLKEKRELEKEIESNNDIISQLNSLNMSLSSALGDTIDTLNKEVGRLKVEMGISENTYFQPDEPTYYNDPRTILNKTIDQATAVGSPEVEENLYNELLEAEMKDTSPSKVEQKNVSIQCVIPNKLVLDDVNNCDKEALDGIAYIPAVTPTWTRFQTFVTSPSKLAGDYSTPEKIYCNVEIISEQGVKRKSQNSNSVPNKEASSMIKPEITDAKLEELNYHFDLETEISKGMQAENAQVTLNLPMVSNPNKLLLFPEPKFTSSYTTSEKRDKYSLKEPKKNRKY